MGKLCMRSVSSRKERSTRSASCTKETSTLACTVSPVHGPFGSAERAALDHSGGVATHHGGWSHHHGGSLTQEGACRQSGRAQMGRQLSGLRA